MEIFHNCHPKMVVLLELPKLVLIEIPMLFLIVILNSILPERAVEQMKQKGVLVRKLELRRDRLRRNEEGFDTGEVVHQL